MKKSKNDTVRLMTAAGENVPAVPWNVYPRPQMRRDEWLCLNGEWDFETESGASKILVPFCPKSLLSGYGGEIKYGEKLKYSRVFSAPTEWKGKRVLLHFGAVSRACEVLINGAKVAESNNAYLPFSADITDALADGELTEDAKLHGNWSVGRAMRASMVKSDNNAAVTLLNGLGLKNKESRERMAAYSGLSPEELPAAYFTRNSMSPRFMIGTLRALYEGGEKYDVLLDYMKQAQPGRYFRSGEDGSWEIAHKYGAIDGFRNDCGIVYTPRPFLLVVFFKGVSGGEKLLGELCRMTTAYSLSRGAEELPEGASA